MSETRTDRESGNAHRMVRYEEYWMRSLFARGLVAALTLGTLAVSQVAKAQTESNATTPIPLFGNEGFGLTNLPLGGSIPSASGYSHPNLAQGFTVGDIPYILESVDLGLVLSPSVISAIQDPSSGYKIEATIFTNENIGGKDVPSDQRVATLTLSPTSTFVPNRKALYKFVYLNDNVTPTNEVTLEAGESYWLVVSYTPQTSGALGFYWSFAAPSGSNLVPEMETPVDKTGITIGFQYLNTLGQHDFGTDWIDHGPASADFYNSGLRFTIYGYEPEIVNPGGGGGEQTPPTLDCYAYSKGYFKNKYSCGRYSSGGYYSYSGWPASVIADGGALIGNRTYTVDQLRTMLSANTTRGNQIGQLASQLVAVHLSRELARQAAGPNYLWWDGWAPDSTEAQAAYQQAVELINASIGFDRRGNITGCVTNVSALIDTLNDYIYDNHCDAPEDRDDDYRPDRCGKNKKDRDKERCKKKVKYERRDTRKRHECR